MQVRVETGPPGDHEPEVYEVTGFMEPGISVDRSSRRLTVFDAVSGDSLGEFDGDDWASVTIDQSMDPI